MKANLKMDREMDMVNGNRLLINSNMKDFSKKIKNKESVHTKIKPFHIVDCLHKINPMEQENLFLINHHH